MNRSQIVSQLRRIPGVEDVELQGEGNPTGIRILAPARPEKQLVRDVESMLSAMFGIRIDHRIVTVLRRRPDATKPEARTARVIFDRVVETREKTTSVVEVRLQWPDGACTDGRATGAVTRPQRGRIAAEATVAALNARESFSLELGSVTFPTDNSVFVTVAPRDKGDDVLGGTSYIVDDLVVDAVARAVLDATNRVSSHPELVRARGSR